MAQFYDGKDKEAKVLNKPEQRQRHKQSPLTGNSLKGQFSKITKIYIHSLSHAYSFGFMLEHFGISATETSSNCGELT